MFMYIYLILDYETREHSLQGYRRFIIYCLYLRKEKWGNNL